MIYRVSQKEVGIAVFEIVLKKCKYQKVVFGTEKCVLRESLEIVFEIISIGVNL